MPIDKETLKSVLHEAAGDDGELFDYLEKKLASNDAVATKFVGGFMRDRDYRNKTQALAADRGVLDQERKGFETQVTQYRQLLEAAETEKGKILKELADHKVSVATANARLKHLKQTYSLSDDDVPNIPDLVETYQTKKPVDGSVDIDQKLADFEKKMTTYLSDKLVPELGGMAQLDIVWADIRDEHRELTGKRLSAKEAQDLFNEAQKRGRAGQPISLKQLWEEKYDAPALRQKSHDDGLEKKLREKWDTEQAAKLSEAALQGVRPGLEQGLRTSQILSHKFKVHEESDPTAAPKLRETPSATDRQALSGAERASKRYLERRASGIPMGAPDERKGKVA